jgi:hypothetical protein
MADVLATSFGALNYSGLLFNKSNTAVPFSTLIGSRQRDTNHVEFTTGLEYTTGGGTQPAISETASLTAPAATIITREQKTNVTQIFQESFGISDAKKSNMGTLSGINIAGQTANPANELDFQAAAKMTKIARDIEFTFMQGVYNKATSDATINKTRGMFPAITTNVIDLNGAALRIWDIADVMKLIYESNGTLNGLVLWLDAVSLFQLNADAEANDLTIVPAARNINGISLSTIITPLGEISLKLGEFIPAGTVGIFNPGVVGPVHQPVPGKGNFYLDELAKTGAGEKYLITGQLGLDHGPEWYHAKITGISTSFTKPPVGKHVYITSPAPTVEVDATMTDVTLDKATVVVGEKSKATPVLNIAPATAGTFAYEWQECATATGTFAAASTLTGYNTAEVTAPAEVPANKFLRCKVTSSGSVEAATLYSDVIEIVAA